MNYSTVTDFLNLVNKENLNPKSLVVIYHKDTNDFSFIQDISFLNVTGFYNWITPDGENLSDTKKHGDVISLITREGDKIELNKIEGEVMNYFNIMYNTDERPFLKLEDILKKIDKIVKNNEAIFVDWSGFTISNFEILNSPYLIYQDSYGHIKKGNYKYPVLAFIVDGKLNQTIKENKNFKHIKPFKNF